IRSGCRSARRTDGPVGFGGSMGPRGSAGQGPRGVSEGGAPIRPIGPPPRTRRAHTPPPRGGPMGIRTGEPPQHDKFRAPRRQPLYDLLALVRPETGLRIVDLGCGTGKLTRVMHQRLRARETVGIDSSDSMLESARTDVTSPGLRFEAGTIEAFAARRLDADE